MKKRAISFLLMALLIFGCNVVKAESTDRNYKDLPIEHKIRVQRRLQENKKPIDSKIKDGNIFDSEEELRKMVELRKPPRNGDKYVFDTLYIKKTENKNYYRVMGQFVVNNRSNSPMTAKYTQEQTKTITWDVGGTISGSGKIGNKFLAEIEINAGFSVSRSATSYAGSKYGVEYKCAPKKKTVLTAYRGGVYAEVVAVYSRYDGRTGASKGKYTEVLSGTAVNLDRITMDLNEYNN